MRADKESYVLPETVIPGFACVALEMPIPKRFITGSFPRRKKPAVNASATIKITAKMRAARLVCIRSRRAAFNSRFVSACFAMRSLMHLYLQVTTH